MSIVYHTLDARLIIQYCVRVDCVIICLWEVVPRVYSPLLCSLCLMYNSLDYFPHGPEAHDMTSFRPDLSGTVDNTTLSLTKPLVYYGIEHSLLNVSFECCIDTYILLKNASFG